MHQEKLLADLAVALGHDAVVTDAERSAPRLRDERGRYQGKTQALLLPRDTAGVAAAVQLCTQAGVAIVPQGGNSGLNGGATPDGTGTQVVIALDRLQAVRQLDAENYTLTVEAGCTLVKVQQLAESVDRYFPLSLGAEGTCQLGGNLSTNAGGIHVLRYGNARDLVLGLEVVLPDGRLWNGLRPLRKDNTGYGLKHLFIGAEGTLGIITAASVKLFPRPRSQSLAYVTPRDPAAAVTLLARLRAASGDQVSACEIMARQALAFAYRHVAGLVDLFGLEHPWFLIVELSSSRQDAGLETLLEDTLATALDEGLITNATVASNQSQVAAIWKLREAIVWAQRPEGASIKHDIAVPLSTLPQFLDEGLALVQRLVPGIRPVPFGHLGDGNMHFNLTKPEGAEDAAYVARAGEINAAVHDLVMRLGGSFSAEHGIGQLKLPEMRRYKSPVELDLMRAMKAALDPRGLMNPGKVVA